MAEKKVKEITDKSFESAINELENIVMQLEKGEATLEESIALFTEGMELSKFCSQKLDTVEQKITQLVKDSNGKNHEVVFES